MNDRALVLRRAQRRRPDRGAARPATPPRPLASLSPGVIDTLVQQYREHPGWTAQLHVDNLRAALAGTGLSVPSYPTVRRYLKAQGMFRQAAPKRTSAGAVLARDRLEHREVRSFELDHVSALWHLDFHHGARRVLTRAGTWRSPSCWASWTTARAWSATCSGTWTERAQSLVHGLSQAFMKRGCRVR